MILILGPCVIESEDHAVRMAQSIKRIVFSLGADFTFKASFDKANRTSHLSYRGPGLERGLAALREVKAETGCRITTDIHEPQQAERVAEIADLIQIPALLSRQTDLIQAAGATHRAVNIKKGQFMAPDDMRHAADKAHAAGASEVLLTERGTTFGYHDLVVDMRSIAEMQKTGWPVIIDASHSVQRPSAGRGCSDGAPQHIATIASAAIAAGANGAFIEVHDDPAHARSDGPNSLALASLEGVLLRLLRIEQAVAP